MANGIFDEHDEIRQENAEHRATQERVAEAICKHIDISFYKWGRMDPEAYAAIMKAADAAIMAAMPALPQDNRDA